VSRWIVQNKPIDMGRLGNTLCVVAPEKRVNPETGEIRRDREGNEQWIVGVSVRQAEGRRTDVIHVVVPGEPRGITEGAAVRIVNLWSNDWSVGGNSGTSYRADEIVPLLVGGAPATSAVRGKSAGGDM
jgi:hypothetical protein